MVGDDEVLVENQLLAEAIAGRARALRRVEGEEPRLDLGDGEAGDGQANFSREDDAAGRGIVELHAAAPSASTRRAADRRGIEIC